MLFDPKQNSPLAGLRKQIGSAASVTPALMSDVIALAGARARGFSNVAIRFRKLIEVEAWTDAALALIEIELPRWKLTRLAFDDGEWRCSLSPEWQLPDWLAAAVDGRHDVLPLAILDAFVEAREASLDVGGRTPRTVPECRRGQDGIVDVCCDNFS